MDEKELVEHLQSIERTLEALDQALSARAAPAEQAMADIEQSYGLVGQLVEVAHAQREQMEALIRRLDTLIAALSAHDQRLVSYSDAHEQERSELRGLMVQLRELARTQVQRTEDLARAVGNGGAWDGAERRRAGGVIDKTTRQPG